MRQPTAVPHRRRQPYLRGVQRRVPGKPATMYAWQALDRHGRHLSGEMPGPDAAMVKARLRHRGLQPQSVRERRRPLSGGGKAVRTQDIALFSRQFATLIASGVPMVQALGILAGSQRNPRLGEMLAALRTHIEGGDTLHEALGRYPRHFDPLFRHLVRAGESAGALDTVLDTAATHKERIQASKAKIIRALIYPATVLLVALATSLIVLVFVVPVFQDMFHRAGTALPVPTQVLIRIADWVQHDGYLLAAVGVVAGLAGISAGKHSPRMRRLFERVLMASPVLGRIVRQAAMARFARTLGVTFRAGVPLVEALDIVADAVGHALYGDAVHRIRDEVAVGEALAAAMQRSGRFSGMAVQMIAIGAESGALDDMLFKVAEFYEAAVNGAVDTLGTLLEPVIMAILGILVGGMVVSLYLPIFKLGSAF